jgi:hypothetical protein
MTMMFCRSGTRLGELITRTPEHLGAFGIELRIALVVRRLNMESQASRNFMRGFRDY